MSTIKDVAKKANVSTATVSRVLNQNYPVSNEAKEKVLNAVQELKYHPNAVARSLKNKKTYMIGMVVPDISNSYFMEIARGVESIISGLGYSLIFCSSDNEPKKELHLLHVLNEKRVDFVLLASCMQEAKELNLLIEQGLNIIMFDTQTPGVNADTILEDNYNATYKLINYVIQQGHRKIAIARGPISISTAKDRFEGFKRALDDNDILFNESYIIEGGFNRRRTYEETKKMILRNKEDLPTVVFAANNHIAEGVMIAFKEMELEIPKDISLVSFGDLTVPQLAEPRLTIISQNALLIGQKLGEILIDRINSRNKMKKYNQCIIESEIIIRNSVKSLK